MSQALIDRIQTNRFWLKTAILLYSLKMNHVYMYATLPATTLAEHEHNII